MTTYRRNLALTIEGMGSSTSSTAGIAWHYGKATVGTPGDYEWLGGTGSREGLIRPPDSVACSVDAFECQMSGNAHSFELHASKLAKSLFFGRPEKPRDILSTALTEDATTVIMTGDIYTWSASDDGTVVWIGDEAILLGTHDAGATFTGCTRGFWSTTAMVQPSGMNVYDRSPKLVNRLAKILVYDRDAGTTTQAWQGFVRRFSVDNAIIRLDCQDIWSAVAGAKVNRNAKPHFEAVGSLDHATQSIYRAGIGGLANRPQGVNKSSATLPQWMSMQVADALFYASKTAANSASWVDDSAARGGNGESRAQLGSSMDPDVALPTGSRNYELLTVDRFRDQTGGTNAATADMRSSSRYLDEPFHPVSISMALLTSSYSAFATAASSFGTTWTLEEETDYYGTSVILEIAAIPGTGDIVGIKGATNTVGIKRIEPDGAGTAVWTALPNTSTNGSSTIGPEFAFSDTHVFVGYEFSGKRIAKLDITDGSTAWVVTTGSINWKVVRDSDTGYIYSVAYFTNYMKKFDGESASAPTATSYTLTGMTSSYAACITAGNHSLVTVDSSEVVQIRLMSGDPGSGAWSADTSINLTTDPTTTWSTINGLTWVVPDPLGTNGEFWIANYNDEEVYKFDADATELVKLDPRNDLTGVGVAGRVYGLAVDIYGDAYVNYEDTTGGANHILRYQSDGTFVTSTQSQSLSFADAGSPANSLAVTSTGDIWISNQAANGYVTRISQS